MSAGGDDLMMERIKQWASGLNSIRNRIFFSILLMVERMQRQMKVFKLEEAPVCIDEMMVELMLREQELLSRDGIELKVICRDRPWLLIDAVHVQEAIRNLISNSVEAMPDGGLIIITVTANRKGAAISIKDNGIVWIVITKPRDP